MNSNPYNAPQPSSSDVELVDSAGRRDVGTVVAWFILFPCVGAAVGFNGYLVAAIVLESSVIPRVAPPKYTYGQQAGLISLPLSTVIGFAAGFTFAGFVNGWRRLASLAMLVVAILGVLVTYCLWNEGGIGECSSAIVLYYPIFGFCGLVATVALGLAAFATIKPTTRRRTTNV